MEHCNILHISCHRQRGLAKASIYIEIMVMLVKMTVMLVGMTVMLIEMLGKRLRL